MVRLRSNPVLCGWHAVLHQYRPDLSHLFFPLLNLFLPLGVGVLWTEFIELFLPDLLAGMPLPDQFAIRYCVGFVPVFCLWLGIFFLMITEAIPETDLHRRPSFSLQPLLFCLGLGLLVGQMNSYVLSQMGLTAESLKIVVTLITYAALISLAALCFWPVSRASAAA